MVIDQQRHSKRYQIAAQGSFVVTYLYMARAVAIFCMHKEIDLYVHTTSSVYNFYTSKYRLRHIFSSRNIFIYI